MSEETYNLEFDGYWRMPNINGIPNKSGVYCVYECTYQPEKKSILIRNLLYIGQSFDVRSQIKVSDSFKINNFPVKDGNELCFSFAFVDATFRERVCAAMIFKHKPLFNDYFTDKFPYDKTRIISTGRTALLNTNFILEKTY